jgi:hypothetical protein
LLPIFEFTFAFFSILDFVFARNKGEEDLNDEDVGWEKI